MSAIRRTGLAVCLGAAWLEKGKRLRYMDAKQLDVIDGIWVTTEIHMTTKKGKKTLHKTVIKNHDTRFNQDLDESLFSVRRLEKGI